MDRESMQRLKFDRRLIGRRNWISQEDLAKELGGLEDASHKIAPSEDADAPAEEASPTGPGDGSPPQNAGQ